MSFKLLKTKIHLTLTTTFTPLCSLVITVAAKLMNQPDKAPSFVLLEEAPTVFINSLDTLPNTRRSNKISIGGTASISPFKRIYPQLNNVTK